MKGTSVFMIGAACGAAVALLPMAARQLLAAPHGVQGGSWRPGSARAHTEEKFVFTANAPIDQVAPLFGADKERVWAPGWDPHFIHPLPATDERGMVFTVERDYGKSVWVNTDFDLDNGRVQYAYVIPGVLATVIRLRLKPQGDRTQVEVEYDRTALRAEADAQVQHMAEQDRTAGADWEKQINGYFEKRKAYPQATL